MMEVRGKDVGQHHLDVSSNTEPYDTCFLAADNSWVANPAARLVKFVYQLARHCDDNLIR